MSNSEFTKGDRVYRQDGAMFEFDHIADGYALCAPFYIIQTSNYHGDDFEEHEELSEQLVRLTLKEISKTPWVKAIHEETKTALEEKTSKLKDIQSQIGAASTALNMAKKDLQEYEASLERQKKEVLQKYDLLRQFNRLIGKDKAWFVSKGRASTHNKSFIPQGGELLWHHILLKHKKGEGFTLEIRDEEWNDKSADIFTSAVEFYCFVRVLFRDRIDKSIDHEIEWFKVYDFLPISAEAKAKIKKQEIEKLQLKIDSENKKLEAVKCRLTELEESRRKLSSE